MYPFVLLDPLYRSCLLFLLFLLDLSCLFYLWFLLVLFVRLNPLFL